MSRARFCGFSDGCPKSCLFIFRRKAVETMLFHVEHRRTVAKAVRASPRNYPPERAIRPPGARGLFHRILETGISDERQKLRERQKNRQPDKPDAGPS
ncbi:hypothetical protein [Bhargavaea ullalensis]|uniref:Uncharacterized protein n=1 Tax=Bhargavaea ullalensis TaxID=1265685 RepID=A0ABV2GD98_9BACL